MFSKLFYRNSGGLSRQLGLAEAFHHSLLLEFHEPKTARALGLKMKSGFTLQNNHVKQALYHLKARHASLQVCIQNQGGKFWFVPFSEETEIPFYEKNSNNWVNEIESIFCENCTFEGQLLWKVTRINSSENNGFVIFIFTIHHAIMDGLAMSNLMVEFSDILNKVAHGVCDFSSHSDSHLLQPVEDYVLKNNLITFLPRCLLKFMDIVPPRIQAFLVKRLMYLLLARSMSNKQALKDNTKIFDIFKTGIAKSSLKSLKTGIIPISLTKEETKMLRANTKENTTTIFGVIVAAASLAFAEMIEKLSGISIEEFESKPLNKTQTTVEFKAILQGGSF